jgi:uncharacterized membrane protein (UPF0127 family)
MSIPRTIFLSLLALCAGALHPGNSRAETSGPAVVLHGHEIGVELATDPASREHGLMGRTRLKPDHGMLFVFPDVQPRTFWMKNTLIPLDILYFDGDRKLVSMQLDVPPCAADPCATYPSDLPARYVLELAAGRAERIGARVGDTLTLDAGPDSVH